MAKNRAAKVSAKKGAAAEEAGRSGGFEREERIPLLPLPRPVSLDAVIGQKRAVDVLRGAMASGRVHHAWLFAGPPGVGKFTAASAFAAELLADRGPARERVLAMLADQAHPDVHVIVKELAEKSRNDKVRSSKQTTIAKDVAVEYLLEPAARSRVVESDSLAHKVFIIDEAELLGDETQDALLKIIEEPPLGTVIVLVTTDEHRLLATVRSRCQRVPFFALDAGALQAWMGSSGLEVEGSERDWLLGYGNGSPGQILSARRGGLFGWHTKLDKGLSALAAGQADGVTALGAAMASLIEERAKSVVEENEKASKESANRVWCKRMLAFVAERLRRQMIGAARAGAPGAGRAAELAAALDAVSVAERQLDANVQYGAVLDNLVAQIASGRAGFALLPQ
ncbi:MAG: AAA family ATPase [Phycisphaerales bacterium]|nr:AAA family ATPase [Phycisphaerales bacterium]